MSLTFLQKETLLRIPEIDYLFSSNRSSNSDILERLPSQVVEEYLKEKKEESEINEEVKRIEEEKTLKKQGLIKISSNEDRKNNMKEKLRENC